MNPSCDKSSIDSNLNSSSVTPSPSHFSQIPSIETPTAPLDPSNVTSQLPQDASAVDSTLLNLLRSTSLLLGLHPDQATESIVDIAMCVRVPFAVVPCCVFPDLFPERERGGKGSVRTTREFVGYLCGKGEGVRRGFLNVKGRNVVVYSERERMFEKEER